MAKVALGEFIKQVRQEAEKVTWSSRKDVVVSTIMVLVMVLIASLFFLVVDAAIFHTIQAVLGL